MSSVAKQAGDAGAVRTASGAGWETRRIIIVAGLAVGMVLGFAGNFLPTGTPQNIAYLFSSLGLIVAGALYALRLIRTGFDLVGIGIALFALGEVVILSAGTPSDPGGNASFSAGVALYALGLPLASLPLASPFPIWARATGVLAAIAFAAHALMWWTGHQVLSGGPLASIGYVLLVITIAGWILALLRTPAAAPETEQP